MTGREPCAALRRRVSAAVLVIDDFTGGPIRNGLWIRGLEAPAKPVRKNDGYFVFVNWPGPILTVEAGSPAYQTERVRVALAELDPLEPVVKLRMKPNRRYGLPPGAGCVSGQATPGSLIRLLRQDGPKPCKLLYDYDPAKDGCGIRLFRGQADLEGRHFQIRGKNGREESFVIRQALDAGEGAYRMEAPLERAYPKIGTVALPLCVARAGEDGRFFLPVAQVPPSGCLCILTADGGVRREVMVEKGKETGVDLRPGKGEP